MTQEEKDALRVRNQMRGITCGKCGSTSTVIRDGGVINAMPGIRYRICDSCGWSRAITSRPKKERL